MDGRSEGLMIKVRSTQATCVRQLTARVSPKLLDSGEVLEDATDKKEKTRKKPLPATYEPGKLFWSKPKKSMLKI